MYPIELNVVNML